MRLHEWYRAAGRLRTVCPAGALVSDTLGQGLKMTLMIEIPDDLASALGGTEQNMCHTALEAIALEGYRNDTLSEADIRHLLGFETSMEVHAFLKGHGAFLPYTEDDLRHDIEVAHGVARRARGD